MQSIIDALEHLLTTESVVHEYWPTPRSLAALPAMKEFGAKEAASEVQRRLRSLGLLERLRDPIMGVCGGLNAGKSSVVSAFLSPHGRHRVPRGNSDKEGTYRFVLWLPESWLRDQNLREAWDELLEQVFGPQRELLSDDVAIAHRQYNDAALLEVPLIAGDPQLENLGMGFLDCPDIETDPPDKRLAMLGKASVLCSALVVVQAESQVRAIPLSKILQTIGKGAPRVGRYILINQTDPERNLAGLLQEVRRHSSDDCGCYVAHQWKFPGWPECVPPKLLEGFSKTDPVPLPWLIAETDNANEPAVVTPDRFLKNLPSQLDPGELLQTKIGEHHQLVREQVRSGLDQVAEKLRADGAQMRAAHRGLVKLCEAQMTDDTGDPKQLFTVPYVLPLLKSMERTAPRWLKPVIWLKKPFKPVEDLAEKLLDLAGEGYESFAKKAPAIVRLLMVAIKMPWDGLMRILGRASKDEAECKIEPSILARAMRIHQWCPQRFNEEKLTEAWEQVLRNTMFAKVEIPSAEKFDSITREIWNVLPWHRQALFAIKLSIELGSMVILVLGLALAPFTFGKTFIAAATFHHAILGPVLYGLTGAAVSTMLNTFFLETNTLPYLSAMLAYACDVFALPRRIDPNRPISVKWGVKRYDLPTFDAEALRVYCQVVEGGRIADVDEPAKEHLFQEIDAAITTKKES